MAWRLPGRVWMSSFPELWNLDVLPTGAFSGKLDLTGLPTKVKGKFAADTGEVDRWIPRGTIQDTDGTVEPFFAVRITVNPPVTSLPCRSPAASRLPGNGSEVWLGGWRGALLVTGDGARP